MANIGDIFGFGGPGAAYEGISGLFGMQNPAQAANPYLSQIGQTIKPYYDPYIQRGEESFGQLQPEYAGLVQDPGARLSQIGAGYQQSPGYQFNLDQTQQAMGNAAAAGGMAGSPQHQQQAGQVAQGLASQDYQNYMNNALGLYGQGLGGLGGIGQMGYGASTGLAQNLAQQLASQAQLAYAGQANQNQGIGNILGTGLSMFGIK